jgi:hypothetical protein
MEVRFRGRSARNCIVTETITTGGTATTRSSGLFTTPVGRRAVAVVIVLFIAVLSFVFGVKWRHSEIADSQTKLQIFQKDNTDLTTKNLNLQVNLGALQAKLNQVQAALDAITPSANKYQISSNESLIVADGHLTIGLVGVPLWNNTVDLNINGKTYLAAAGDVINVTIDPSMNCRVKVMSFDALSAQVVVNATCAETKQ